MARFKDRDFDGALKLLKEAVKKNADLTFGEVGKALGCAWGELSEKDKAAWKAKAEKQTAKNAADFKKKK